MRRRVDRVETNTVLRRSLAACTDGNRGTRVLRQLGSCEGTCLHREKEGA